MTRHINADGLKLIKQWEGLRTTAYQDSAGIWTIGYGHTSAAGAPKVSKGMKITEAEAEAILARDLRQFEDMVEKHVKVPMTDNQFVVLVSFALNVGPGNKSRPGFTTSTLLRKLNAGDYKAVPVELMKWVNSGGRKVQGLVNRRAAEGGLWAKGEFVSSNYVEAEPEKPKLSRDTATIGAVIASGGAAATFLGDMIGKIDNPYALGALVAVAVGLGVVFWARFASAKEAGA